MQESTVTVEVLAVAKVSMVGEPVQEGGLSGLSRCGGGSTRLPATLDLGLCTVPETSPS